MAKECQIDECGVLAIGRCIQCGLAFCTSHQAFAVNAPFVTQVVNQCVTCRQVEVLRRPKSDTDLRNDAQCAVKAGPAKLRAAGVPTEKLIRIECEWRLSRIFRIGRFVTTVKDAGQGWILGSFLWLYPLNRGSVIDGERSLLTVLKEDGSLHYGNHVDGYSEIVMEASEGSSTKILIDGCSGLKNQEWVKVAQALNRLIEEGVC